MRESAAVYPASRYLKSISQPWWWAWRSFIPNTQKSKMKKGWLQAGFCYWLHMYCIQQLLCATKILTLTPDSFDASCDLTVQSFSNITLCNLTRIYHIVFFNRLFIINTAEKKPLLLHHDEKPEWNSCYKYNDVTFIRSFPHVECPVAWAVDMSHMPLVNDNLSLVQNDYGYAALE